jgi:hypothetical protein
MRQVYGTVLGQSLAYSDDDICKTCPAKWAKSPIVQLTTKCQHTVQYGWLGGAIVPAGSHGIDACLDMFFLFVFFKLPG